MAFLSLFSSPVDASCSFNKDIFFNGPGIKLKNTTYMSTNPGGLTNVIPQNILPYDEDDDDNRYSIINALNTDPGLAAADTLSLGTAQVSSKEWAITGYTQSPIFSVPTFFTTSSQDYQTLTPTDNTLDLSTLTTAGIDHVAGSITLIGNPQTNIVLMLCSSCPNACPNLSEPRGLDKERMFGYHHN